MTTNLFQGLSSFTKTISWKKNQLPANELTVPHTILREMIPGRAVIYVRDVRNATGRSETGARTLLRKIREELGKKPSQFITIDEFCAYTGMKEEIVRAFMKH